MSRETVRLPELSEASRTRARFVHRTFGVVLGWLVLLVLGAGWAVQTLRFDLDLPVTGQIVAVDADGTARLIVILDGGAPGLVATRTATLGLSWGHTVDARTSLGLDLSL
ncbi:MAG: hypothetical protein AAGE94_23450, partial [Acidobacteriota bacterium]